MKLARQSIAGRAETDRAGPSLTELAAAKFVEAHGRKALSILEERAELAEELGHRLAAATWHGMADAVARILDSERRSGRLPGAAVASRVSDPARRRTVQ